MSFLSSSRCVLMMGDEGLQIFKVKSSKVERIDFVLWDADGFVRQTEKAIIACNRAPIVVLNDMVEQHYRKERIPKVSILDQANVLKRRLSVAFPNYRVRAALKLKDKKTPAAGDKKGQPYLFAAVPASDSFNKTLEAIRVSNAPIKGFYLLPIEASSMVQALSRKLAKSKSFAPIWTIFIGQHHNGGLRQIVTRNGELALTRLTPIVDTDVEPEMWAKEIAGELDATMSYLSRFGYQPTDGLDIIISTNEASKTSLEQVINVDADIHLLTSGEIAKVLGVKIGKQEDYRYADPVHAAYLGKKNSFTLPLQSVAITQMTQPRKIATGVMLVLIAGIVYFGYTAFENWTNSSEMQNKLFVASQKTQSLIEEYNLELDKQKELGFDFRLVDNALSIYGTLEKGKLKPLPIIREIGKALGVDIKIEKLSINQKTNTENQFNNNFEYDLSGQQIIPPNSVEVLLTISFPSSIDTDVSVARVIKLRDTLASSLLDYEVSIAKQIADLSYTGNVTGGAGASASNRGKVPEKYEAIIQIVGEVQ